MGGRHAAPSDVKIFGRDPILWSAFATSMVTALAVLGLGLSAGLAGAIDGVLIAAVAVWTTRPITPGVFTGVVTAAAALLAELGIDLADEQTVAVKGVVVAAFALLTRQQVSPQQTAVSRA